MGKKYYKYGISPEKLKEVRKYIIQDIKSNNDCSTNFSWCMTLQNYLNFCKEILIGSTNEEGYLLEPDGSYHLRYRSGKPQPVNIKEMPSVDVCKMFMDGRGLFTEHFNSPRKNIEDFNFMGRTIKDFDWDNLGQHDENQWYHEDRLDDPAWFKFCNEYSIGAGGHPCEHWACHIYPVNYEGNNWYFLLDDHYSIDYFLLNGYLHLKKQNVPVFITHPEKYLTEKQKGELNELYI